jgi:uncharacterized protein (DUF924 family)
MEQPAYHRGSMASHLACHASDPEAARVLRFWFGQGGRRTEWFAKDAQFDARIAEEFLALHGQASAGALERWQAAPPDCLALIVVLDQFPRNMFRGTPRAFATDSLALGAAQHAVARRYDAALGPCERLFLYLPFEHAESLAMQDRACELLQPLSAFPETHDAYRYAVAHRDIIARFGRFPHRNAILGRASTPEELEFLKGPGSSF